jgi:hypothetical protein
MKGIPKALQLPVVIERFWPSSSEPQLPQKLDFLFRGVPAQGFVIEELLKPRLQSNAFFWENLRKLKSL